MDKEDYWTKRAEENIVKSEEIEQQQIKKIKKVWEDIEEELEAELTKFYYKNSKGDKIELESLYDVMLKEEKDKFYQKAKKFYKEAKEKKWREKYKTNVVNNTFKKKIKRIEELRLILNHILQEAYEYERLEFSQGLQEVYKTIYTKTMHDFQTELNFGFKFDVPNELAIEKILEIKWLGENYSDRIWKDKVKLVDVLERELLRGFALGENPREIGKRIANKINVSKHNTERLARTEFNRIANLASFASVMELDKNLGGNVFTKYRFLATLDKRTSIVCQELDLKEFLFTEKQEGINFPPIHPNCRSTYKTVVRREVVSERIAKRLDDGKVEYIPSNIPYKEWAKKFQKNVKKSLTRDRGFDIIIEQHGGLAQLGEHLPYKQRVSGSSPLTSTIAIWRSSEVAKRG